MMELEILAISMRLGSRRTESEGPRKQRKLLIGDGGLRRPPAANRQCNAIPTQLIVTEHGFQHFLKIHEFRSLAAQEHGAL